MGTDNPGSGRRGRERGSGASAPVRLSGFYGAYFAMIGVQLPFWPLWLASRGLDAAEIGTVLAASVLVKVASNPLIAQVADRRGERRPIMVVLGAAALLAFSLFPLAGGFWSILLISMLFVVFWSAIMPLGESLTMLIARERGLDYGRVRLWGSLAFIVAAVVSGRALVGEGEQVIFWMMAGTVAATLVACALVPGTRPPRITQARLPMGEVLRRPGFVLLLVAASLIQGSHGVYYGFGTLHWRAAGHSEDVIGWLWAEGVIAEIVLFAFGARLVRRLGPAALIAIGGLAAALRWTITALSTDLAVLVGVQALHALTFAAAHLGAIHLISRAVPPALSATAQGLYAATVAGLGAGIAMGLSGTLYAAFGGRAYLVMAAFGAAGAAAAAGLGWRRE